ncbi:MAG: PQQ-binding-like beta-propeller repeat protein [Ktedonobacteraceae bacterium]|nr:PQQ-binding-like beta-propeller repeat protein [Ktedonobacteraceae bacterium]
MGNPIYVLTQHNDTGRTGANLEEVVLTTSNVNQQQFGKVFERQVDGQIYAQPLYVSNLAIPNKGTHNVVYVATMHNSVYAFDADDPQATSPLWKTSLEPSVPLPDPNIGHTSPFEGLKLVLDFVAKHPLHISTLLGILRGEAPGVDLSAILGTFSGYKDIVIEVGIISTPVISLEHNALYAVTATKAGNEYAHHLHALDLTTGVDKFGGPVRLEASVPGTGDGSVKGSVPFVSHQQLQRVALLLCNDIIYIAFASYGDADPYHGWVFAYHATTLQQVAVYNTTPNGGEGGIWMAGQGPSADNNYIYVMVGNGTFEADASALGNTIVKFKPDLTLADWFAPFNSQVLSDADADLGSSGVLLIPDTNLLLGGGKEGKFYLVDKEHLGHFNANSDSQIVQSFYVSKDHHIHGGPVYWHGPNGPWVYVWPENDYLRAYRLINGQFQVTPVSQSTTTDPANVAGGSPGMPGGMLSISANGNTPGSGVIWASHPYRASSALHAAVEGIVRAYDAADLTKELWNSKQNADRDDVGNFAKFCPPTVANGKVYMASFGRGPVGTNPPSFHLAVYGLLHAADQTM